jgi:hypothetical protein
MVEAGDKCETFPAMEEGASPPVILYTGLTALTVAVVCGESRIHPTSHVALR